MPRSGPTRSGFDRVWADSDQVRRNNGQRRPGVDRIRAEFGQTWADQIWPDVDQSSAAQNVGMVLVQERWSHLLSDVMLDLPLGCDLRSDACMAFPALFFPRMPRAQKTATDLRCCDGGGLGDADDGPKYQVARKLPNNCSPRVPGSSPLRIRELRIRSRHATSCSKVAPEAETRPKFSQFEACLSPKTLANIEIRPGLGALAPHVAQWGVDLGA